MVGSDHTAEASLADIFDRSKFGIAMAAIIKMTVTTIKSSISEKPFCFFVSSSWKVWPRWPKGARPNHRIEGPLPESKKEEARLPPLLDKQSHTLLDDLSGRQCAASSCACTDGSAGYVKADYAGMAHAKRALARGADV